MTVPPTDVAVELAAASIGLTLGTNLFTGPLRDVSAGVPKNAVFIKGLSGGLPQRTMGEVNEIREPLVSVTVRNSSFNDGDTKVRQIQEALQAVTISGYLDVEARQSEPLYLEPDDQNLHRWIVIFSLKLIDAA